MGVCNIRVNSPRDTRSIYLTHTKHREEYQVYIVNPCETQGGMDQGKVYNVRLTGHAIAQAVVKGRGLVGEVFGDRAHHKAGGGPGARAAEVLRHDGNQALACAAMDAEAAVRGLQTQCGVNFFILDTRRVLAPAPTQHPRCWGQKHVSNPDFACTPF